jgi:hypothetical protein
VTGIKQGRFCLNIGPNYVEVRFPWIQPSCASFPLSLSRFTLSAHENNTEMSIKIPPKLKRKFCQNNDKNEDPTIVQIQGEPPPYFSNYKNHGEKIVFLN